MYSSGMTMVETPPNSRPVAGRVENLTNMGKGKAPGTRNRTTTALKDAILLAAAMADSEMKAKAASGDPNAKDKPLPEGTLEGYLCWLAQKHPQSFAPLMGRIIPIQIKSTVPIEGTDKASPAQLGAALAFALRIGNMPRAKTIEHEEKK